MDYNRIQIGSVHLTADGTQMGAPCRVIVPDLAKFTLNYRRSVVSPIEGPPAVQLFDNLIGEVLQLSIFQISSAAFDSIVAELNSADESNSLIRITLTEGAFGDYDFYCTLQGMTQSGEFRDDKIPGLTFTFVIFEVLEESSSSSSSS